ncbi:MAG: HipA domain-containing protein [Alphaproteobacteria bacterium]|nr:HipA domain-containing protein [Alphaproteobacteria bacterium]
MADLLWGKVYHYDVFAGYIREEPGNRMVFTYDETYLNAGHPPIAYTLPLREAPYVSENGLHPFFDNLVAEGWLAGMQAKILGKREPSRFELLLAFGIDCIGAISIIDAEPVAFHQQLREASDGEKAVRQSRSSLSGVQQKLAVIKENGIYRPTRSDEISTHIAKFDSAQYSDITDIEYLTMIAFQVFGHRRSIANISIGEIAGIDRQALIVKRFDRESTDDGKLQRIHFEEFNQLLGKRTGQKYDGAHKEMADFIITNIECVPTEKYILYKRILTGLLLGNSDMHFKNFAMFYGKSGLLLTPSYDQVAAVLYGFDDIALEIFGARDHNIKQLQPKHMIGLGHEFQLSNKVIQLIITEIENDITAAKDSITQAKHGTTKRKNQLIKFMEKRWNDTFKPIPALIGKRS